MDKRYNFYNLEASFKNFLLAGKINNNNHLDLKPKNLLSKPLNPISVKNYLSDIRHFLGWAIFFIKSHLSISMHISDSTDYQQFLNLLTSEAIEEYKSYLFENSIPVKTINRRLSTVRKFFTFCINQNWLKENPAKRVSNIFVRNSDKQIEQKFPVSNLSAKALTKADSEHARITKDLTNRNDILNQFHQNLLKERLDSKTIKSCLDDVREFLSDAVIKQSNNSVAD